jgi:prokaryotic ubiquitin-like protein Pup
VPGQERKQRQGPGGDGDDPGDAPTSDSTRTRAVDADVDAVLDEIDEVLETNAEEFVRSFVQKGGE